MSFIKNFLDGGAGEAQAKNEANVAWIKGMLETQYGIGNAALLEALSASDTGYQVSLGELGKAGETATNQILASQAQTNAANKASLVSSGLSGTTLVQNMQSQVHGQTATALGGLAEQLGAQKAGLAQQHAGQQMQGLQSLAQFAMGKVSQGAAIMPQYQAQGPGFLGALGQGAGKAAGLWLGSKLPGGG